MCMRFHNNLAVTHCSDWNKTTHHILVFDSDFVEL